MSLLRLQGVKKHFGAVQVLHGVDLDIHAGEVVGLVGDNGAGKSTLMKTITGIYKENDGSITLDGTPINGKTPGERRELGIEMIYQDLALAKQQDVASNIFLGREPTKRLFGWGPKLIDRAEMNAQSQLMIDRLGAHLPDIQRSVGAFSGGQQQTVAIARALTFNPRIVIMDEPTAALAVKEVQSVLNLIRKLKEEGVSVILISHRLNDVLSVTDRVVVLRQGVVAKELHTETTSMSEIVSAIVGDSGEHIEQAAAHESA
ncbi:ATP-binding cassette domain-containing protein [Vibrio nigripulchritudo]|uniref:ATP-binding cassette domain-containing protein n=1 Tax=Vibrio nigripulchritudo TaxID=28173 RepID=UPI002491C46D|nr:ATP-binding cassette domain-containing protein [Vibrio nigripulchritudo]BDU38018.1 ABC transporter permease [Vibrio nigripulchritudo]BDU43740.1 ABC transporter permease [Vibrio nigripulchritudo]